MCFGEGLATPSECRPRKSGGQISGKGQGHFIGMFLGVGILVVATLQALGLQNRDHCGSWIKAIFNCHQVFTVLLPKALNCMQRRVPFLHRKAYYMLWYTGLYRLNGSKKRAEIGTGAGFGTSPPILSSPNVLQSSYQPLDPVAWIFAWRNVSKSCDKYWHVPCIVLPVQCAECACMRLLFRQEMQNLRPAHTEPGNSRLRNWNHWQNGRRPRSWQQKAGK